MRIISKKKLRDYYVNNPQAKLPLVTWYYKLNNITPKNLTEIRRTFNSADPVHGYTVFNVGGNNYRLVTALHYNTQRCYIRKIWTHAEYSKVINQEKLKRGEL